MKPFFTIIVITILALDYYCFFVLPDTNPFTGGILTGLFTIIFLQGVFFIPGFVIAAIALPFIAAVGGLNEKCPECGQRTLETVRTRSMISGTECSGFEVRKRKTYSKDGEHSGYVDVSEPSSYAKFWITEKTTCSNCNYKNKSRYKETEKC